MKKTLTGSLLSILVLSFLSNSANSEQLSSSAKASKDDSLAIIQLENNWSKALVKHDVAVFEKYLAAELVYTENDKIYTRDDVIQSLNSVGETIEESYNEDIQVHVYGNTAIATGLLYVNGKSPDGNFKRKYRYTDIWLNRDGEWQLVAAQDYLFP